MNTEFEQLVEQYMNFDKKALAQLLAHISLYGNSIRYIPYPIPYQVPVYPYELPQYPYYQPVWVTNQTITEPNLTCDGGTVECKDSNIKANPVKETFFDYLNRASVC